MGLVKEDVEADEEISEEFDDIHALLLPEDHEEEEEKRLKTSQVSDSKTAFHYLEEVKKFFEDKPRHSTPERLHGSSAPFCFILRLLIVSSYSTNKYM